MKTKLTLSIDQTIIEKANKYASSNGQSLSYIVGNYLKAITKDETSEIMKSSIVLSLKGSFKSSEKLNYKKNLAKGLSNKYL